MRAIEGRGAIFCFLEGGSVLYGGQVSANPERSKGVSTEHVQGERIRGRDHRQAEALRLGWFWRVEEEQRVQGGVERVQRKWGAEDAETGV